MKNYLLFSVLFLLLSSAYSQKFASPIEFTNLAAKDGSRISLGIIDDLDGLTSALLGKEPVIEAGTSAQYWRGDKTWQTLDKSAVGLGNVPNVDATDRSNHTGTQSASTITGLSDVAISGSYNDLSDIPSIPQGTVTSVGMSVPTGFTVSGSPVTESGSFTLGYDTGYQGYTSNEANKLSGIEAGAEVNVNADWNAVSGDAHILNKPVIPQGTVTSIGLSTPTGLSISGSPVTSTGTLALSYASGYQGYTTNEASKLSGIATGAEVNVQSDWNAGSGDAHILNKPTLGGAAALNVGTTAGTVAAGDDARLSNNVKTNVANQSITPDWGTGPSTLRLDSQNWDYNAVLQAGGSNANIASLTLSNMSEETLLRMYSTYTGEFGFFINLLTDFEDWIPDNAKFLFPLDELDASGTRVNTFASREWSLANATAQFKTVADDTARFALTTSDVKESDYVFVSATETYYVVLDDGELDNEDGYGIIPRDGISKIQFRRGLQAELDGITLASGEPGWTTDTKRLYVGDGSNNNWISAGMNGKNMLMVNASGTPTENGTALLAAYAEAKASTPNGNALSATNQMTIVLAPGIYDLGTGSLVIDTEWVHLTGATGNPEDCIITSAINTDELATVMVVPPGEEVNYTSDSLIISNLTVQITATGLTGPYAATAFSQTAGQTGGPYQFSGCIFRNLIFRDAGSGNNFSMGRGVYLSGNFYNCKAGNYAFGSQGFHGYAEDCIAGNYSFSFLDEGGSFVRCVGGNNSFNTGYAMVTVSYIDCKAGNDSFKSEANTYYERCIAGNSSFQSSVLEIVNSIYRDCRAGTDSFVAESVMSSEFIGCSGGEGSFCSDFTNPSTEMSNVVFKDCTLTSGSDGTGNFDLLSSVSNVKVINLYQKSNKTLYNWEP